MSPGCFIHTVKDENWDRRNENQGFHVRIVYNVISAGRLAKESIKHTCVSPAGSHRKELEMCVQVKDNKGFLGQLERKTAKEE
jgi:hypothetical protein